MHLKNESPLSKNWPAVFWESARTSATAENRGSGNRAWALLSLPCKELADWLPLALWALPGPVHRGAPCSLGCHGLGDCIVLRASAGGLTPARRALLLTPGAGLACPTGCCMGHGRMSSEALGQVWCQDSTYCPIMRILFVFLSTNSFHVHILLPTAAP